MKCVNWLYFIFIIKDALKEKEEKEKLPVQVIEKGKKIEHNKKETKHVKEFSNYDYDGKPLLMKMVNPDILPSEIAKIEYKDFEPVVNKKAYQQYGITMP